MVKIGLVNWVFTPLPMHVSHQDSWTVNTSTLPVGIAADESVRPFCSDIFQRATLNTQADCAEEMSCNSRDSTPKWPCCAFTKSSEPLLHLSDTKVSAA